MAGYTYKPKEGTYTDYEDGSAHPAAARDEYESSQDVFGNEEGATVSLISYDSHRCI